jgi:type II secretory pathway pseudopilin PulG
MQRSKGELKRQIRLAWLKPTEYGRERAGRWGADGFTLVELLVLVLLLTFMSILILPTMTRAKQRAIQATCQSNLKQTGFAMQVYAQANNESLPGPVSTLAAPSYEISSTNQLIWFLAERLGLPQPSRDTKTAPQLLCPAHPRNGAPCVANYVLNDGRSLGAPPFGSPMSPVLPPLKLSAITASTTPAKCCAIADADKGNVNAKLPGWSGLPYVPVHGKVRNELFFDWHVAIKGW